jgi:hypothetical protein
VARREADGQHLGVQRRRRAARDLGEEVALGRLVSQAQLVAAVGGAHPRVLPHAVIDAVGDGIDGRGVVHVRPHLARRDSVQLGDGVGVRRQPQAGHRHIEGLAADAFQLLWRKSAQAAQAIDLVLLIADVDRRVRGEDDLLARLRPGALERRAPLAQTTNQLEPGEHRVPLVEMIAIDGDPQRLERAHAAHAQDQLLRHAIVVAAAVEPPRHPLIFGVARLQQIQRRVVQPVDAKDRQLHVAPSDLHVHRARLAMQETAIERRRLVVHDAVGAQHLPRVAFRPGDPHADHRQRERARAAQKIAGQDAQAAGIDRQPLREAILHTEVGDSRVCVTHIRVTSMQISIGQGGIRRSPSDLRHDRHAISNLWRPCYDGSPCHSPKSPFNISQRTTMPISTISRRWCEFRRCRSPASIPRGFVTRPGRRRNCSSGAASTT